MIAAHIITLHHLADTKVKLVTCVHEWSSHGPIGQVHPVSLSSHSQESVLRYFCTIWKLCTPEYKAYVNLSHIPLSIKQLDRWEKILCEFWDLDLPNNYAHTVDRQSSISNFYQ